MQKAGGQYPRAAALQGKKVVVKIGGSSIASPEQLQAFAKDVAVLVKNGVHLVLVHGGGPEINEEMKRRGLDVKKVAGLRVTDEAALSVVAAVLGRINAQIVEALRHEGLEAVGMAGAKGNTILSCKMPPFKAKDEAGKETSVDLGRVGEVTEVRPAALWKLLGEGKLPVLYPVCAAEDGGLMNVNADTVAAELARGIKAEELVLVTDVPGVMREFGKPETAVSIIKTSEVPELVAKGIVSGGMIPKVEACRSAVESGVRVAHMIDGKGEHALARQLLSGHFVGTRIVR